MKAGGKPLVGVGDIVREGQVVAAIESLNVHNEVEATVSGRVREILIEDGQSVEYGQPLVILDPLSV
jgi:biotin carboxyl carrier protein